MMAAPLTSVSECLHHGLAAFGSQHPTKNLEGSGDIRRHLGNVIPLCTDKDDGQVPGLKGSHRDVLRLPSEKTTAADQPLFPGKAFAVAFSHKDRNFPRTIGVHKMQIGAVHQLADAYAIQME